MSFDPCPPSVRQAHVVTIAVSNYFFVDFDDRLLDSAKLSPED